MLPISLLPQVLKSSYNKSHIKSQESRTGQYTNEIKKQVHMKLPLISVHQVTIPIALKKYRAYVIII
jgi:hypothetical protein